MVLREGLGMFYSSPSISGVGKAGVLLRKREALPLAPVGQPGPGTGV